LLLREGIKTKIDMMANWVKVLLNKFLHHKVLKGNYRVIAGLEDTLTVNKRKGAEEE